MKEKYIRLKKNEKKVVSLAENRFKQIKSRNERENLATFYFSYNRITSDSLVLEIMKENKQMFR